MTEEDRAALVDISTVHIDPALPPAERAAQYIAQIKNPDCFLCNGVVVHLQFDPHEYGARRLTLGVGEI